MPRLLEWNLGECTRDNPGLPFCTRELDNDITLIYNRLSGGSGCVDRKATPPWTEVLFNYYEVKRYCSNCSQRSAFSAFLGIYAAYETRSSVDIGIQ